LPKPDIRIFNLPDGHFEFFPISEKGKTMDRHFDEYDVVPMSFQGTGVFVSARSYEACRATLEREGLVFEEPDAVILGEGDQPDLDEGFSVRRYNETGFLWETRVPGRDKEDTWECGGHEFKTLTYAVLSLIPDPHVQYGISLDTAARILLELDLILHTGVEINDIESDLYDGPDGAQEWESFDPDC
jgi:hypothetical protein